MGEAAYRGAVLALVSRGGGTPAGLLGASRTLDPHRDPFLGVGAALGDTGKPPAPPRASRGPRIGRGEPVAQVRGVLAERVILSTELDPWMSLRALAGYSGLSVRRLRDCLTDPGHPLPHYRVGGKLLVRRSDYDAWAARYRRQGDVELDQVVIEALRGLRATPKPRRGTAA